MHAGSATDQQRDDDSTMWTAHGDLLCPMENKQESGGRVPDHRFLTDSCQNRYGQTSGAVPPRALSSLIGIGSAVVKMSPANGELDVPALKFVEFRREYARRSSSRCGPSKS